jgi:hypothetical protein
VTASRKEHKQTYKSIRIIQLNPGNGGANSTSNRLGLRTPSINTIFNSFTPFASEQQLARMSTLMVGTQQGHKK